MTKKRESLGPYFALCTFVFTWSDPNPCLSGTYNWTALHWRIGVVLTTRVESFPPHICRSVLLMMTPFGGLHFFCLLFSSPLRYLFLYLLT